MSARVDVRAVLEKTDDHLQQLQHYGHSADLRHAMHAVEELVAASARTVKAFESLGRVSNFMESFAARKECEAAMVAQKAAVLRAGGAA